MQIVDVNVLLNAVNADTADHVVAKAWLDRALSGASRVGFAWLVLIAFVRLTTRRGLFPRPLSTAEALDLVDGWLGQRSALIVHPTERHSSILRQQLLAVGTAGNLTNDAHLAALSIEHRGEVVSFDSDFDRFPDVTWKRPS